jgi:hypothetical protein
MAENRGRFVVRYDSHGNWANCGRLLRGSLSDLRLYDRALSTGEIDASAARDGKASQP